MGALVRRANQWFKGQVSESLRENPLDDSLKSKSGIGYEPKDTDI